MPSKTWKSEPAASAGVAIGSETARMHGTDSNYIQIDSMGTFVSGKVSFMSTMPEIRTGALWKFNTNWNLMIPSTLGTPQPTILVDNPVKNIKELGKQAALMMSLFGMFSSIAG
jgi:hypothetical protein